MLTAPFYHPDLVFVDLPHSLKRHSCPWRAARIQALAANSCEVPESGDTAVDSQYDHGRAEEQSDAWACLRTRTHTIQERHTRRPRCGKRHHL